MGEVKISVIVPVYNVEAYLPRCIDSILAQSFRDFELLLIDDGATDSSGKICDEYVKKDERIRVFHKSNGGAADARNYGIGNARGAYLTFVDPDDYVVCNFLEALYCMIIKQQADVALVGMQDVYDSKSDTNRMAGYGETVVNSSKEIVRRTLIRQPFGVSPCARLFKRKLFETRRFPVGKLYEDLITIPYVFSDCDKLVYSDAEMYCYFQRSTSAMHHPFYEKDMQVFDGLREILDFVTEKYPDIRDAAVCRYIDDSLIVFFQRAVWQKDYAQFAKRIKAKDKGIWKEGLHNRYLKKTRKIQILMLLINTRLFQFVYRIKAKQEK